MRNISVGVSIPVCFICKYYLWWILYSAKTKYGAPRIYFESETGILITQFWFQQQHSRLGGGSYLFSFPVSAASVLSSPRNREMVLPSKKSLHLLSCLIPGLCVTNSSVGVAKTKPSLSMIIGFLWFKMHIEAIFVGLRLHFESLKCDRYN